MTAVAWAVIRDEDRAVLVVTEQHPGEIRAPGRRAVPLVFGPDVTPPADALAAVTDAVRLVEDAIDATSERAGSWTDGLVPTDRTGLAVVEALVEAGWTPPEPGPPAADRVRAVLREVLSTFTEHAYVGRPVVRSGWQYPEVVDRWRAALDEPDPGDDVRAYDAAKAADTGVRVPLTDLVAEALDELDEPGP